uniref:Polyadenylate-binding protein 1-B-binding protein n=1 Tax=Davidia involucrata TaxID=16924 RepID=A0A5B7BX90_DAVIN
MDKEQEEIQFLGFFGIFKESFKIISSWRRIFSEITLAIILPLSFIFLAHIEISELLFAKILHNEYILHRFPEGTPKYAKLSDIISSEWTAFWLFKISYFIFFLILSLLSTSAVVYTIACIYTAKEITFKKVMSVVPKVWKRLMVTFIWNFIIVFAYNVVALVLLVLWVILIGPATIGLVILAIFVILYLMGFVYTSVVWHLASVVSVLEDVYGIQAMIKSNALIKGKMGVAIAIFLLLTLCFIVIQLVFQWYVVLGKSFGSRIGFGILCFLLLFMLILFGLVIQTVLYFVCKSYHHENIDKSSLADHLEVYLGEYVPLKAKDVQLEQFDV